MYVTGACDKEGEYVCQVGDLKLGLSIKTTTRGMFYTCTGICLLNIHHSHVLTLN